MYGVAVSVRLDALCRNACLNEQFGDVVGAFFRIALVELWITGSLVGISLHDDGLVGVVLCPLCHFGNDFVGHGCGLADFVVHEFAERNGFGFGLRFGFSHDDGFWFRFGLNDGDNGRLRQRFHGFVSELESYGELCRHHPVVAVVVFGVEAVVERVGVDFETYVPVFADIDVEEQTCAEVVAEQALACAAVAPCVCRAFAGLYGGRVVEQVGEVVVVPRVVEADTADEDDVEQVVVLLREEVGEVEEHIGVGVQVVELIRIVDGAEAAFRFPCVDVQTCTDGGCEEASDAYAGCGRKQVGERLVGEGGSESALQLYEVVGVGLVAQSLCFCATSVVAVGGFLCRCGGGAEERGNGEQGCFENVHKFCKLKDITSVFVSQK